jgi:hypothetical protein
MLGCHLDEPRASSPNEENGMNRIRFITGIAVTLGGVAAIALPVFVALGQSATPEVAAGTQTIVLVEHADAVTQVDIGPEGVSPGDVMVWGPDPLYDATNVNDTGATTQGSCFALNANFDCVAQETILWTDGSTLEFQGIELGGGVPSMRTIVGGSGRYLGAIGTMSAEPNDDLTLWTKTINLELRASE